MATFSYRAVDGNANILTGSLQARDEAELEGKLTVQGLTLIEAARSRMFDFSRERYSFKQQDLVNFSYFLHLIIASGLPITAGLKDIVENRENRKISHIAELLHDKLDAGMSLSDAMREQPALFPDYYVQMVAAGEASGSLEKMLGDLMQFIDWQIGFKKSVRNALAYPVIVMSFVSLLILALFTFVFPRLVTILVGLHAELPLPTRIIMFVADAFSRYYPVILSGGLGLVVALRLWMKTYEGKRRVHAFLLRLPLVGSLITKIDLSRYSKTLATLHAAGLNIEKTLTISASVVGNVVIAEALAAVTESVMNGESIAVAMKKTGIFPSLVTEMVSIGEKSGNLEGAMRRVSEMYDREVPDTLKKVLGFLEPAILLMLGVVVLGVLLSVFLPIYKIVGGVKVR